MAEERYFISDAVRHPGGFTAWVWSNFGRAGFTKSKSTGKLIIKPSIIAKAATGKCPICERSRCVCPNRFTRKQAVLARTLREIRERQRPEMNRIGA